MDKLEQLQGVRGLSFGLPVAAAGWLVVAAAGGRFLLQRRAIEGARRASRVTWDLALVALVAAAGVVVLVWLAFR